MASSGQTRILALNTTDAKYLPVRLGPQLKANSLSFSLATDDGKLPSALDVDRLKTVYVKEWASQTIVEETTVASEESITSSVVDLDGVGGDCLHLFVNSNPVAATNLTIVVEQSFDNVTFFVDTVSTAVAINKQHITYLNLARYVRFIVTNGNESATDITLDSGSFA